VRWITIFEHLETTSALIRSVAESVGRSIVLSRLDYCNSLLYSAISGVLDRLQRLHDQVDRTVESLHWWAYVYPILLRLHWLPVRQRITYKLAGTVYSLYCIAEWATVISCRKTDTASSCSWDTVWCQRDSSEDSTYQDQACWPSFFCGRTPSLEHSTTEHLVGHFESCVFSCQ